MQEKYEGAFVCMCLKKINFEIDSHNKFKKVSLAQRKLGEKSLKTASEKAYLAVGLSCKLVSNHHISGQQ